MRTILATIALVLFISPCWGEDKGLNAYNNGYYATAIKEWTPLAEQGNPFAQYNLGQMFRNGQGVLQDDKAAVKWYTLAAEQGDADAQHNIGIAYSQGKGVLQDYVFAHMWINIAAANGNDGAPKSRDIVQDLMTPAQIEQAQVLARECVKMQYKDC